MFAGVRACVFARTGRAGGSGGRGVGRKVERERLCASAACVRACMRGPRVGSCASVRSHAAPPGFRIPRQRVCVCVCSVEVTEVSRSRCVRACSERVQSAYVCVCAYRRAGASESESKCDVPYECLISMLAIWICACSQCVCVCARVYNYYSCNRTTGRRPPDESRRTVRAYVL